MPVCVFAVTVIVFSLYQAKPIYGGWLLLAPEGTNFDNPLHRSRVSGFVSVYFLALTNSEVSIVFDLLLMKKVLIEFHEIHQMNWNHINFELFV